MSWKTTPEQNAIIEWQSNQLVVNAFAGTGKTTTLVQFAQANPDMEMHQAIRLLDEYFPLPQKLAIMRRQVVTHEKDAQVTVSTAPRIKGLEWEVVVLNEDFCYITDPLLSAEQRQDETNLLYVAVTRARKNLVLNELMLCLRAGEEQKDGGQPATDDMENDRRDAVFPC